MANSITPQTAASRMSNPRRNAIAARVSRTVKKYVKGTTMVSPNKFRTKPFASGCPAASAIQRGISERNQNAAATTLKATNAYVPQPLAEGNRKRAIFELVRLETSFLNGPWGDSDIAIPTSRRMT